MINRPELLAFEFYKLRPFKGSDTGIRYMIQKETVERTGTGDEEPEKEDVLAAYIWPEPFCFEVTPDGEKGRKQFDFSEEGLNDAISWLNENHDAYANTKK